MTYATETAVRKRLGNNLTEDPSEEVIEEGIAAADDIIEGELSAKNISISIPPSILIRAAIYLAAGDILDSMTNTDPERAAVAAAWEKRGMSLIERYIESQTTDSSEDGRDQINQDLIGSSSVEY